MQKSDFTLCSFSTLHTLNRKMSLSVCSLKDIVGSCCHFINLNSPSAEDELRYVLCGGSIGCNEKNPIMSLVYFWCYCGDCLGVSGHLHSDSHQIEFIFESLAHPSMKPSSSICCITVAGSTGTCAIAVLIVCVLSLSLHAYFATSLPPFCLLHWFSLSYLPVVLPFCLIS